MIGTCTQSGPSCAGLALFQHRCSLTFLSLRLSRGRGISLDASQYGISIEFVFPDIYIKMNDEERKRFAGHALRMFQGFLEYGDLAKTASGSYDVSARLVRLARFLLSFGPKPRRSIATQTDAD